jgi:3-hydroxyisobutyrate dehydrogenase-like beta-hydroxyacid dehydrogenase
MCGHILAAGYTVSVYNRTASKAEELCRNGAKLMDSPRSVAQQSDVVFTIVGYPKDVEEVVLGENGILKGLKPQGILVDMTTSDPTLAKRIFSAAQASSCHAVDAPVSGGDVGAKNAKLSIFAGGKEHVVASLGPLFSCMGSVYYMGGPGNGQHTKLGNQVIIASTMVGLIEGMIFATRSGLDITRYLQAVSQGLATSKSLQLYASRLLKRDLRPGFYVNHFVKDLGLAIEECRRMNLSLPGLLLAHQLYGSLRAHGEGDLGTQALVLALERLNNVQLPVTDGEI